MNRVAVFPFVFITLFLSGLMLPSWGGLTSVAHASSVETDDQFIKAEFVAYYTNLQRRAHGLAPLKMSKELTEAALLFAEDAIVNLGGTYCDYLVFMSKGRIATHGTTGEILNSDTLRAIFGIDAKVYFDDYSNCLQVVFRRQNPGPASGLSEL